MKVTAVLPIESVLVYENFADIAQQTSKYYCENLNDDRFAFVSTLTCNGLTPT